MKVDRRIIKTKTSIILSLIDLLKEKDYTKITVEDIVNKADIARKTFYLHFSSKDDIILQVKNNLYEYFTNEINNFLNSNEFDIHTTFNIIKKLIIEYYDQLKFVFLKDTNVTYFSKVLIDLYAYYLNLLLEKYYKLNSKTKEYYFSFYSEGFISTLVYWLKKEDISLDELILILERVTFIGADELLKSKKI